MKIKVICNSISTILSGLPSLVIGFSIALFFLYNGVVHVILPLLLVGIFLLALFLRLTLLMERSIEFTDSYLQANCLSKRFQVAYGDIEFVKFRPANKYEPVSVVVQLKKRIQSKKKFVFEAALNEAHLLELFNFLRSQSVPTGLNGVGRQFLSFDKESGLYVKKVKLFD